MARRYIPGRGDIVFLDFNPVAGHEQAMKRPALVLSVKAFNQRMKLAMLAPITHRVRGHGFEVLLEGSRTHGAVLCHQIRMIDYGARRARLIEKCPQPIIDDALARVRTILA